VRLPAVAMSEHAARGWRAAAARMAGPKRPGWRRKASGGEPHRASPTARPGINMRDRAGHVDVWRPDRESTTCDRDRAKYPAAGRMLRDRRTHGGVVEATPVGFYPARSTSFSTEPAPSSRTSSVSRATGSSFTATSRVHRSGGPSWMPGGQPAIGRKPKPSMPLSGRPDEMPHRVGPAAAPCAARRSGGTRRASGRRRAPRRAACCERTRAYSDHLRCAQHAEVIGHRPARGIGHEPEVDPARACWDLCVGLDRTAGLKRGADHLDAILCYVVRAQAASLGSSVSTGDDSDGVIRTKQRS